MANQTIKLNEITHYNETNYDYPDSVPERVRAKELEVDKSKSISELTTEELRRLINRLRDERDAENTIRDLRISAGQFDRFENLAKIDTKTPVDQLYHWGIMGMKWGQRRYQNEDGSRTAAGKKREEFRTSEDYSTSRKNKQKGSEGLSNEELRKLNERLQLEATYVTLTTKQKEAESFVTKALKKAAGDALSEFAKGAMLGAAKSLVKEIAPSFAETSFGIKQPVVPTPTTQLLDKLTKKPKK